MELWLCLRSRSAASAAYQAPVVVPVPVYTWTGLYLGINGGYGFGQQTPGSLFGDAFSAFNYNANGWWAASRRAHRYRMAIRC
jgi:outer membrane immunogenic protein